MVDNHVIKTLTCRICLSILPSRFWNIISPEYKTFKHRTASIVFANSASSLDTLYQSNDMSGIDGETAWTHENRGFSHPDPGDEIVISGISGKFPNSDNMNLLKENLMNKAALMRHHGWDADHLDIPPWCGKINDVTKFDAVFFGVHAKQARKMDPMGRILLERAYEAVIDAGVNPRQLFDTNTGVFIGSCYSETENAIVYDNLQMDGFGITGCSRSMLANRISWWFGIHGPSCTLDTACSSSLYALECGYSAIRDGRCDAAIIGASNLCLHPHVTLQFARLGLLAFDGRCKVFDESADGYVRSEAIGVIYLQKAKDAKRIYANVIHAKTNCDGFKEQGVSYPSSEIQSNLMKELYDECEVPPSSLSFVEAHAIGTKRGAPEEIKALEDVFLEGRDTPLLVGSVKSNLGHAEPASGICAIAKVVIAMESGYIPPNMHYNSPSKDLKAVHEGRIKIVNEVTPWNGGYVGINAFGFGGANAHVLLKSHEKEKINNGIPDDDLPRLVVVSGRTEEAISVLLDELNSKAVDVEYISLFHDIHAVDSPGHLYRGFTILPPRGLSEDPLKSCKSYQGAKRPVWFVYSGMGSQWCGMGEALMRFPVFAEAIRKCDAVLKPRGVDIIDVVTSKDPKMFENILNAFIGIAAVQIGLTDLLTSVGIVADNFIGHSVGELGCAYGDGCFTAEQMILASYSRGVASLEMETIFGSMAAVGLGYTQLKPICPDDIEIACHNSAESSTISGPAESVNQFVAKLQADNIFAKAVSCANIAYHSRYIASAGPKLFNYLKDFVSDPKPRSSKWISSSVPRDQWDSPLARFSSAEYHTNNLLCPVLFEEASRLIPKDAITIEIAPYGLLQAILRKSLGENVTNIALAKRGYDNNVGILLQALGQLYEVGLHPQLQNLYPTIEYPVSRGTPMIAPHIRWNHTSEWELMAYKTVCNTSTGERNIEIGRELEHSQYMTGHVLGGRNLIPIGGYLTIIWETLANLEEATEPEFSVVFDDVKFHRVTPIPDTGSVVLTFIVQKGTGKFAVVQDDAAVVTGVIRSVSNPDEEKLCSSMNVQDIKESDEMSSEDVYKTLRISGYHYSDLFRGISRANVTGTSGRIAWLNNWAAFIDGMLQMKLLETNSRELLVPAGIRRLVIDTELHKKLIRGQIGDKAELPVQVLKHYNTIVSGGIELRGLTTATIARRESRQEPVLEKHAFVPYRDQAELPIRLIIRLALDVVLENHHGNHIKTLELIDESSDVQTKSVFSRLIHEIIEDLPSLQSDINIVSARGKFVAGRLPPTIKVLGTKDLGSIDDALVVVTRQLFASKNVDLLKRVASIIADKGFILAIDALSESSNRGVTAMQNFDIILEKRTEKNLVKLLRKKHTHPKITTVIRINNDELTWLPKLQNAIKSELKNESKPENRILVLSTGDFKSGITGLINCLRKEPGGDRIQGLFIQDPKAPTFSLENPFYNEQLKLDLVHNVVRQGNTWGSYRFLQLESLVSGPVQHAIVSQITRGDISSLEWIEGPLRPARKSDDILDIHYSSLNFRDVMLATGRLGIESLARDTRFETSVLGCECSGIKKANGRRVMGIFKSGAMANTIRIDSGLHWNIPDDWTLEDAATVPVAYGAAYYALYVNGRMQKGDKVLIHAGSGGVGQAAITLALHENCEVFTTVGTPEKRDFIKKNFPRIDDDHIGNSRDTTFEELVLRLTKGKGVDVVLNCLAEEKMQASLKCLAHGGRFLEIGKSDLMANKPIGMGIFLKEVSFHGISLDDVFNATADSREYFISLMENGIASGVVKPLVRTVFPREQVQTAFRYMAAGKHIGKVLIKIHEDASVSDSLPLAMPRFYCLESSSYLIHGGLDGFGLELAEWLVLRGAKKLVLTTRDGIRTGYQRRRIHYWKTYGVETLLIVGKDASTQEGCEEILKDAVGLGPVDAIFNLAVVSNVDSLFENQTMKSFEELLTVKVQTTKQLDNMSRIFCPYLRQFVVFSSISSSRGNAGQTNSGMANSIVERICESRAAEGLPALAIEWGASGDIGLVAELLEESQKQVIDGTILQGINSSLQKRDGFLRQQSPVVSTMVVARKQGGTRGFTDIIEAVTSIIGLKNLTGVNRQASLAKLGLDSLMAIEIKQTLEREFDIFLSVQEIRNINFAKLFELSEQDKALKNRSSAGCVTTEEFLVAVKRLVRKFEAHDFSSEICLPLEPRKVDGKAEIFLVPGIDGSYTVFRHLYGKLKLPATCLHFTDSFSGSPSVAEEADFLLPHIVARMKDRTDFVIAGYSYGSLVAIELARRLEFEGFTGRLVLVDGAPELLKDICIRYFSASNDNQLQSNVLIGLINILEPAVSEQLVVELPKLDSWDAKFNLFSEKLPESFKASFEHNQLMNICGTIYDRIRAILNYDSSKTVPINSPIVFVSAADDTVDLNFSDNGLESVTEGEIVTHLCESNHVTILGTEVCAAAINGDSLDDEEISKTRMIGKSNLSSFKVNGSETRA